MKEKKFKDKYSLLKKKEGEYAEREREVDAKLAIQETELKELERQENELKRLIEAQN